MKKYYFEFNNHDYYALIAVNVSEEESTWDLVKKTTEIYTKYVSGESVEEVLEKGFPTQIAKHAAFYKFAKGTSYLEPKETIKNTFDEFMKLENDVLVVDGALF